MAGATPGGGPGRRGGANSARCPARCSRTKFTIAQGLTEALFGLGVAEPVNEERAQRLVAPLVDLLRHGEPLRAVS